MRYGRCSALKWIGSASWRPCWEQGLGYGGRALFVGEQPGPRYDRKLRIAKGVDHRSGPRHGEERATCPQDELHGCVHACVEPGEVADVSLVEARQQLDRDSAP